MPTPEKIFQNRKIVARGNTLPPSEISFLSFEKEFKLNKRRMELIVKKAETYLDHQILVIPLSEYRRYQHDGNRAQMSSYYFPRREAAMFLALAEMYERKGRFTNKLIDFIWAMLEESTWLISAHFRGAMVGCEDGVPNYFGDVRIHDISLFAAATGSLLAFIYRYCRDIIDGVSPIIGERIRYEVSIRILKPYLAKNFAWMGLERPNRSNWLTWITSNILFTTAVFADDRAIRECIVQRALNSLDSFLSAYNHDGGCDEGPSYWGAAAGALLDCLDTLYDISGGKINIYDHPLIKAMGEYRVDVNIFDDNVVNFADSGYKARAHAALVRRYGEVVGSKDMLDYAKLLNKTSEFDVISTHIYRTLRAIYEPDVEEVGELSVKPAVYYDGIKIAMIREKAVRGDGLFFAMKGGHNAENHNHTDVGTFMLYRDKTPIIVDIGSGEYINWSFATREKCWYKDSDFHSLPTFDGFMQKNGIERKSKNEVFSPEEKALSLEISEAYDEAAGVKSYVRRGEIKDGKFILTDEIGLDKEREIAFYFTTPTEPKVENGAFVMNGGAKLSLNVPAELSVEAHETAYPGCKSWGAVIYRVCFKLKSDGGKFIFTVE